MHRYSLVIALLISHPLNSLTMSSSTSTTFRVSEKPPEKYNGYHGNSSALQQIGTTDQFRRNHCTEVLQGSNFPPNSQISGNGFVHTVVQSYNRHHNLVLRPDDLWTAIMVQFSFYVNKEAEKFRGKFVDFEGKKELEVKVLGSLRSVSYALLVKLMSKKIDENLVDPEIKAWILPSFSTTTDDDLVTCGVVFMATMKKYFDYKFSLCCGIPHVTLEGTVADWENVRGRLQKLKEYELGWWVDMLAPILDQFVAAKKGKPDVEFWQKVCSRHGGGSGPSYLSGWITAFCVFDKDGNRQGKTEVDIWGTIVEAGGPWIIVDMNDIPPGNVEVDVKIDDNGKEYNSVMFAGHLAHEIKDAGFTLQPTNGWAICLKPTKEEIEKIEAKIAAEEKDDPFSRYRR